MTALADKARAFMRTYPRPSDYGSGNNWGDDTYHLKCAQFCWRLADFVGWAQEPTGRINSATNAGLDSGYLNPNWRIAPVGAWHFWRTGDGHVVQVTQLNGEQIVEGYRNPAELVGVGSGFDSFQGVDSKIPNEYMGWATNYSGGIMPVPVDAPVPAYRRTVGPWGASRRLIPTTVGNDPIVGGDLPAGDDADFDAFIRGGDPYGDGRNLWGRGRYSGHWFWLGAMTVYSTDGLTDLGTWSSTPVTPPPATVPENPDNPGFALYDFPVDFPQLGTKQVPASRTNWEPGNFPARPLKIVWHQWDDPAKNPTIAGVLATFRAAHADTDADPARAPHFTIDDDGVLYQHVSLNDRAYHAGPRGNDFVGVELTPRFTPAAMATARALAEALRDRNDGVPLGDELHRNVSATSCGKDVEPHLPELKIAPVVDPPVEEPPTEEPPVVDPPVEEPPVVDPPAHPEPVGFWARLVDAVLALVAAIAGFFKPKQ